MPALKGTTNYVVPPIAKGSTTQNVGVRTHIASQIEGWSTQQIIDAQRVIAGQLIKIFGVKPGNLTDAEKVELPDLFRALGMPWDLRLETEEETTSPERWPEDEYQTLIAQLPADRRSAMIRKHRKHKCCQSCGRCSCLQNVRQVRLGFCNECT